MLLGPPLGGFLYQLGGYSLPFIVGAAVTFVQAFFVMFFLKDSAKQKESNMNSLNLMRGEFIQILGVIILGSGSLTMLEPIIPLILTAKFGVNPLQMGIMFSFMVLAFGGISPIAGKLSDHAGRRPIMIIASYF